MRFKDRAEAATQLADRLSLYRGRHPLVLGVARAAVPMARIIAEALAGDLDVLLVRKLCAPGQPEFVIGAVDDTGAVLRGRHFHLASAHDMRGEVRSQLEILRKRRALYTQARPAIDPAGRIVIIVDDGIATGSSMMVAIRSVRGRQPAKIVVAVGAAPPEALAIIRAQADDVLCLQSPPDFHSVGECFADFSEVTDEMVVGALARPMALSGGDSSPLQRGNPP
jgi:predicted phosphoribosyltransferase